jgi:hypothetical protein
MVSMRVVAGVSGVARVLGASDRVAHRRMIFGRVSGMGIGDGFGRDTLAVHGVPCVPRLALQRRAAGAVTPGGVIVRVVAAVGAGRGIARGGVLGMAVFGMIAV